MMKTLPHRLKNERAHIRQLLLDTHTLSARRNEVMNSTASFFNMEIYSRHMFQHALKGGRLDDNHLSTSSFVFLLSSLSRSLLCDLNKKEIKENKEFSPPRLSTSTLPPRLSSRATFAARGKNDCATLIAINKKKTSLSCRWSQFASL